MLESCNIFLLACRSFIMVFRDSKIRKAIYLKYMLGNICDMDSITGSGIYWHFETEEYNFICSIYARYIYKTLWKRYIILLGTSQGKKRGKSTFRGFLTTDIYRISQLFFFFSLIRRKKETIEIYLRAYSLKTGQLPITQDQESWHYSYSWW